MLDWGGGIGSFGRFVNNYYLYDIDRQAIESAKKNGIKLYEKKSDCKFDVITCFDVIEHMNKADGFVLLSKFKKLLNNGGLVIISSLDCASFYGTLRFNMDVTHIQPYTIESTKYMLEQLNFKIIDLFITVPLNSKINIKSIFKEILLRLLGEITDMDYAQTFIVIAKI